jgi:hypothetical protein
MFASIGLTQTNRGQIEERDVMEFAITADLTPEELPTDFKAEALIQDLIQEAN